MEKQDIVQIKMPHEAARTTGVVLSRAVQLNIGKNKSVIIYNKANGYIVDALFKAVFNDAH